MAPQGPRWRRGGASAPLRRSTTPSIPRSTRYQTQRVHLPRAVIQRADRQMGTRPSSERGGRAAARWRRLRHVAALMRLGHPTCRQSTVSIIVGLVGGFGSRRVGSRGCSSGRAREGVSSHGCSTRIIAAHNCAHRPACGSGPPRIWRGDVRECSDARSDDHEMCDASRACVVERIARTIATRAS